MELLKERIREEGIVLNNRTTLKNKWLCINQLLKLYVDFNNLCKTDEKMLETARDYFNKLENGDEESVRLWNWFSIFWSYDNIKYDDWNTNSSNGNGSLCSCSSWKNECKYSNVCSLLILIDRGLDQGYHWILLGFSFEGTISLIIWLL